MKPVFTLTCALLLSAATFAQEDFWNQAYNNPDLNPLGYTTFNFIEPGPDGTMYLAEQVLADFTDYTIRVQQFDGEEWSLIGSPIATALYNAPTAHFDFEVTPEGQLYVGVPGSIYKYDGVSEDWVALPAPDYIGGLTYAGDGVMYFISRQEGATGPAHSNLQLSRIQANDNIQLLETMASDLQMTPVLMSRANQIVLRNDAVHVCVHAQSTNGLYFFRGNTEFGITPLQPLAQQPALIADFGLSSMVVANDGTVIVSRKSGDDLLLSSFEQFGNAWEPFTTEGINATSCNVNQLRYDNGGVLHLIYNGSNGTGFIFAQGEEGWTHVGPTDLPGLLSVSAPHLAFDADNEIYFVAGIGTQQVPLIVRTTADVNDITVGLHQRGEPRSVSLYPNPARGFFTIDFSGGPNVMAAAHGSQVAQMRIFGADGTLYHSASISSPTATVSAGGFAAGVYVVVIEMENGDLYRQKLVVQ